MISWVVLIVSGMLEAVWANALAQSHGMTRFLPMLIFFAAAALSMSGLGLALKHIPVATGYAVWVGVGAVTTALWAFASGAESVNLLKVVCIAGIILSVIGLHIADTLH